MSAIPAAAPTTSWIPTANGCRVSPPASSRSGAHALASKGWDTTEWGELLTLAAAMATAYGVSNQ